MPTRLLKISNLWDRNTKLTDEAYLDLLEDMKGELSKVSGVKAMKIVENSQCRFGAEVGSTFVEFEDCNAAKSAYTMLHGRDYDSRRIKLYYVDEDLYSYFFD